ncbi:MAG: radical SAM protein [Candidatus Kuenenia sp.]|nr:radical SAM protein [Candidatus Kuenenia hertensis]
MNILLIDPPFYRFFHYYNRYFPLGLSYLSSVLKKAGHNVTIYDADCNTDSKGIDYTRLPEMYAAYSKELRNPENQIIKEISETLRTYQPNLVGITVMTPKAASAFTVASLIKTYDKKCNVVFGGPHATLKPSEIFNVSDDVDFVISGEGEGSFLELANSLENKENNFERIAGLSYCKDGKKINNGSGKFIDNLDTLPVPDRDSFIGANTYTSEDMGLIMGSRGCPFNCSYCATQIWTRKVRYRSITNIIEEIKYVYEKYGTHQFTFKDDSFTVNRKRVTEFCEAILKQGLKIKWDCNTRADLVDFQLLKIMKKAGCNSIKVGVESGSERILKIMDKGVQLERTKETAKLFRKAGIHWTAYFMMGVPTETKEDIMETVKLLYEIKPSFASVGVYEPFPGTRLFDIGVERGLVKREMEYEEFFSRIPSDYYLKDVKRRSDTMDQEEFVALEKEVKETFHDYNKNIARIFERAKARSSVYLYNPKILLSDIEKFLGWMR